MATLLTDDFTRADSTTALGTPTSGGPYTVRVGTFGINSNRGYAPVSTANAHVTFPAAINVDMQMTVPVLGTSVGMIVRWVDASNFWYLGLNGVPWALMHNAAGSFSAFVSTGPAAVAGDVIRVVAYGKNLYGYVNGRMAMYAEDQFFGAATVTAGLRINSSTATRIDDLSVADASGIPSDSGTASLIDLADFGLAAGPIPALTGLLYKGRDSAAADAGSEA